MSITDEMIQNCSVTIYDDTDKTLIRQVQEYNDHMADCRIKKKHHDEIIMGYALLNLLVTAGLMSSGLKPVFGIYALEFLFLPVFAVACIISVFDKKNLLLSTAASALLIFVDIRFTILLVADIVIYFLSDRSEKDLKTEPGYPFFADIHIRFQKGNSADFDK